MDYTAVGETTHLAARMEQMAAPGSILIGPRTVSLAEGYVNVRRLGPFRVKGLAETIEVHELLGPGTLRSRVHQAAARGFASFVGREHEGHDADLGDHDGPIRVITMLRSEWSRLTETRTEVDSFMPNGWESNAKSGAILGR